MITTRRSFIGGALALITAPAIVRAQSLMPVRLMEEERLVFSIGLNERAGYRWIAQPGHEIAVGSMKIVDINIYPSSPDATDNYRLATLRVCGNKLIAYPKKDIMIGLQRADGRMIVQYNDFNEALEK